MSEQEKEKGWFQTADLNVPIIVPAIVPAVIGNIGVPVIVPAIVPMVMRTVGLKAFIPNTTMPVRQAMTTNRPDAKAIEVQEVSAPNRPIKILNVDKQAGTVTLYNISSKTIDITGWRVVSATTNKPQPGIEGSLLPGEKKEFPAVGENIWHAGQRNDGALFDPNNNLMSYWNDPT